MKQEVKKEGAKEAGAAAGAGRAALRTQRRTACHAGRRAGGGEGGGAQENGCSFEQARSRSLLEGKGAPRMGALACRVWACVVVHAAAPGPRRSMHLLGFHPGYALAVATS